MKPAPFAYHAPRSLDEAVAVLADVGHDGKVLAGGQSLIPILNMRLAAPAHLVDLGRVEGLDDVEVTSDGVRVGALVRHAALEHHEGAYAALPLLREALGYVAHPVIRNRGTTVGSLAHADPAGEMPAVLALTGGVVEVLGARGRRQVVPADFFTGPLETSLDPDELVRAVRFTTLPAGTSAAFVECSRRHGDYAVAGVAAAVTVRDGVVVAARASYVSVTPVPAVLELTGLVAGQELAAVDWAGAASAVADFVEPEDDIHASADYRRMLAVTLTERALDTASRRHTGAAA